MLGGQDALDPDPDTTADTMGSLVSEEVRGKNGEKVEVRCFRATASCVMSLDAAACAVCCDRERPCV